MLTYVQVHAHTSAYIGLSTPDLLVDLLDGQIKGDDFVADKKLHSRVVFQQCNQLTIYS